MLQAYAAHVAERAVLGIPPLPLSAKQTGELIELVMQDVTPAWVSAISAAQSVRYRVCRDEYALTAGDIQAFGMVAAKIRSATRSAYKPNSTAPTTTSKVETVEYQGMKWRPTSKDSLFN